jgi:hypothetical protein
VLLACLPCSRRAETGIAGGGRNDATAGRRAAAAAEAACELCSVPFKLATPLDVTSWSGLRRGGEYVLYASSGARKPESGEGWLCPRRFSAPRLGCVSTGTGGGTGAGAEEGIEAGEAGGDEGVDIAAALAFEGSSQRP